MKPVVYIIEFADGTRYVGSTVNFRERYRAHRRSMRRVRDVTSKRLAQKFQEFGEFRMYRFCSVLALEDLHLIEADVIAQVQPELNVLAKPHPVFLHKAQPVTHGQKAYSRAFGPYPSLVIAAKELKTNRTRLREYGTYEAFMAARDLPNHQRIKPCKKSTSLPRA